MGRRIPYAPDYKIPGLMISTAELQYSNNGTILNVQDQAVRTIQSTFLYALAKIAAARRICED